ncbi:hypothetical protein ACLI4Y_07005 [Natrialbaceae archaeon A-CW3]
MTDEQPPVERPVSDRPTHPRRQHASADVAPELYGGWAWNRADEFERGAKR